MTEGVDTKARTVPHEMDADAGEAGAFRVNMEATSRMMRAERTEVGPAVVMPERDQTLESPSRTLAGMFGAWTLSRGEC